MLVHIKDLIKAQSGKNYAIGAFNIYNLESALGIAYAAQAMNSPVIIQVSESTIQYAGLKPITHIVSTVAKNIVPEIPVALHLDHGKSFDSVIECINAGFTSVHIDASDKPLDENIRITQDVIEYARQRHVWVQGEVGMITGGHGQTGSLDKVKVPLATSAEVLKFVKQTKVNTIAAAVGTAHGVFTNEEINFELIKDILKKIDRPFVLHGGSGVSDQEIKKAIRLGVDIINIGTDIKEAFVKAVVKVAQANSQLSDPRDLLNPAIQAIKEVAINKMKLFGSAGQA